MKRAGPKNRGDYAPKNDGMARQHQQRRAVEESDEKRAYSMDDGGENESTEAEVRDLREGRIGPAGNPRSSQQIYGVPDAVVTDQAVE